jgi:glycyl-tRNA synthetase beta chain
MSDFLLELRSEEIPARMQAGARADLEKLFCAAMKNAGVTHGDVTVWSTPRRLALIARDLPNATEEVREEVKGPKTSAPVQALEGFLRKTGLTQDQLTERDGIWFAVTEKPGRATIEVLSEAIPAIIRAFPWPKSMRWGKASISTESPRWVRPLSGIVAILGEQLVSCEIAGVTSQYATLGHRFHHPDAITIGGAHDYQAKLHAAHVIVDHIARQDLVCVRAKAVAVTAGLTLVEDEGLVIENAGLTEWPVPLLGRFDPDFLEVPPEVIQLTARTNQKYFICRDAGGKLADAFVCTANIAASDGGIAIVDGNRKVLAARLSDARFFWEQDRKKPLAEHAQKLDRITFHEKLGTVADKVERMAMLARWLVEEGIISPAPHAGGAVGGQPQSTTPEQLTSSPSRQRDARGELADQAELAARLCKVDLVTEMVGEFPELQGLMGGYYARAESLPDAVADAIRDHYKPVGQGDDLPTAPVTVAVSLADKIDSLFQFFVINNRPSGSKDPFALRRSALGMISIIVQNDLRLDLMRLFDFLSDEVERDALAKFGSAQAWADSCGLDSKERLVRFSEAGDPFSVNHFLFNDIMEPASAHLHQFLFERLKVQQREVGVRHDLIDASTLTGIKGEAYGLEMDIVRLLARVHALQAFIGTEDGINLLSGYKRAANILKKEGFEAAENVPILLSYTPEPSEKALVDSLAEAGPRAATAVEAEDFAGAMAALASLRGPIDAFFDSVTVNDPAPEKRLSRLALLDSFRAAVHKVADFSKIEG